MTMMLAAARMIAVGLGVSMFQATAQAKPPRYEATITRTSFGMPNIKAKNFGGLGFGAAYAEAEDNICLMADAYVSSAHERSKFFGADQTREFSKQRLHRVPFTDAEIAADAIGKPVTVRQ